MTIKNILVPVDFSKCALNALKVAVQLAQKWDSKIFIIHATHIPVPFVNLGEPMVHPFTGNYDSNIRETMDKLEEEIPGLDSVRHESKELKANLMDSIEAEVKSNDIDLIVMGTKGTHDSVEKLIGSHTADVIRIVKVPVLAIPENVQEFKPAKIGIANDARSIRDPERLAYVTKFADLTDAEIDVFCVSRPDESVDFEHSSIGNLYQEYFQFFRYEFFNISDKKIEKGIIDFTKEHGLDFLVMLPRDHALFDRLLHGSMTERIAMKIHIPLLTIHD